MKFESELAESVFRSKYLLEGETEPDQAVLRVAKSVGKVFPDIEKKALEYIGNQWFIPAGGIWRAAGNPSKNVSHINCTTLTPVEDNLEDIFNSLYKWAKYAAFGQGEGIDISKLRPRGAKVHNSSRASTGAVSFMYLYDAILKTIAQQGRRGASLISIQDTHPDLMEFITIKNKPESDKSRIDTANISIQISDLFMKAVKDNNEWVLSFENKYELVERTLRARDIFEAICANALKRGDPGLQFKDTARHYSNSDPLGYPVVSTNACGEQYLDSENVCNLGHINLSKYKDYGVEGYHDLIDFGVRFQNAIRLNEIAEGRSPTKLQEEKINLLPRTGLGVTALADYFLDKGIRYGSKESIGETAFLFKSLASQSYLTGNKMAKEYGSFPIFDSDSYKKSGFIQRMIKEGIVPEKVFDEQYNVCYNTIAPVGSGSLISNCGGSGIEPLYSKYSVRRERSTTGEWKDWFNFNPYVERFCQKEGIELTRENVDQLQSEMWATSYNVPYMDKVELVAEAQKWIDSSISVTFNLPETATIEDVKAIYMTAWEKELKGVTVYREGSLSGVLITEANYTQQQKEKTEKNLRSDDYKPRPKELPCHIYNSKYKEQKLLVLVGLQEGEPYEVFVTPNNDNEIDTESYKEGVIVKRKSGHYDLEVTNGVTKTMINNIGKVFNPTYGTLSRMVSMSLRHNVPLQFVVDQLNKDSEFIAFEKVLSRTLKRYIKDNTPSKKKCPDCGSDIVYRDGCQSCSSCSWSRCD